MGLLALLLPLLLLNPAKSNGLHLRASSSRPKTLHKSGVERYTSSPGTRIGCLASTTCTA